MSDLTVPISSINIGARHRRDMGDLQALANSIAQVGLLQPIGVSPADELVFGERRLRACRDILGWAEIPARVIDLPSVVLGEHAENEIRKDFTPSERVAIGLAIERQFGERRGGDTSSGEQSNPQNFAEYKGHETREIAAEKAGFGNRESYRQARTVVEHGIPELVEAMDAGQVAISAAAELARVPVERQGDILRKVISHALAEDSAPTKADIQRAINGNYTLQVMLSSESTEWYTPAHIRELALEALGAIDLDPCWHREAPIKASTTYTMAQDGLAHPWSGRVWLNPPYGRAIGLWIDKLVDEHAAGRVTEALALIPARVDTDWFRALDPFPRCFPHGRLVFANAENSVPFPVAIPYLGPNVERFAAVFDAIGGIWALWRPDAAAGIAPA